MADPQVTIGAGVTILGPNQRLAPQEKQTLWTHVCFAHLNLNTMQHPIAVGIKDAGVNYFDDLLGFAEHDIDNITYEAGDEDNPNCIRLPRGVRLKIAISMFHDYSRQLGGNVRMDTISEDEFDRYRMAHYSTLYPLGRRFIPPPVAHNAAPRATPAKLFNRGIKKDKDHYAEFKDEKAFDKFRRNVEATAHTHGVQDVLGPTFQPDPNDPEDQALFQSKSDFMFTVFEKTLLTDKSAALVRQYELTRNAQRIWSDLIIYQRTSTAGALHKEKLLTHLTTHKLSSLTWKGSYFSYITHWQNQL
ncbi:MAG: hypothetical protein ACRCZI_04400, partial [Cetobacterium sp.]